ncbi:TPA: PorV/PorQ family protein [Candidatus Poribacteria bacterium]|nr:PorV/PorQ family protein [Candidatus Poribacteria bacterium]HIA67760.1 PorV/PorQ family protein [Candidatus Poribacteria bacterium]HIB92020.1 PorV/PorQ family protein [Candidatus Poribacteria bacterium]HIB99269.1 PorV/PorQ family protein [Candidatus Poribacteria bacterium]HIN28676.1 PorV/PorQ family protein [Candidatus Poribacteria bacterium]
MKYKRSNFKRHIKLILIVTILIIVNIVDVKAVNLNVGRDGWAALKIGVGARASAMGDTFVAVADDVNSIYWNPSGLGRLARPQFSAMHSEWLAGIRYEWIGFAQSFGKWLTLGSDISYVWTGEIPHTINSDQHNGFFDYNNTVVRVAAGSGAYKGIRIGAAYQVAQKNVNFVANKPISNMKVQLNSMNIGIFYQLPVEGLHFGAILKNVGGRPQKFDLDPMPVIRYLRIGIAYTISIQTPVDISQLQEGQPPTQPKENKLILAADVNSARGWPTDLHLGLEYVFQNGLVLRGGYQSRNGNEFEFLSKLSGGFGYATTTYRIDYAFVPFGDLGQTHRISFTLDF